MVLDGSRAEIEIPERARGAGAPSSAGRSEAVDAFLDDKATSRVDARLGSAGGFSSWAAAGRIASSKVAPTTILPTTAPCRSVPAQVEVTAPGAPTPPREPLGKAAANPGAAGQPASGADPGAGPGTDAGTEPDTGTEPDPGTGPDAGTEPEPPVYPSDCTRSSKSVKDPNTGITWNTVYYCGNDGAVGVYEKANYNDKVGVMDSTNSWFVCWKAGAEHGGKNNIWYYTQGSVSVAGWGGRAAWGFMPAVDVHTQHDPDSAIPRCTF